MQFFPKKTNRLPALPNSASQEPRVLEIKVPALALQENRLHNVLTQTNIIQSIMTLPPAVGRQVLQQHIDAHLRSSGIHVHNQMDGVDDTSDDEISDMSDDKSDNDDDDDDNLPVSSAELQISRIS